MKITTFDKATLKLLRAEMDEALAHVAAKRGITLRVGNMSYTAGTFTAKVEATCAANADLKRETLSLYARTSSIDLNRIHTDVRGNKHRIVDFMPRRKKPWITQTQDGKQYCVADTTARIWFAAQPQS